VLHESAENSRKLALRETEKARRLNEELRIMNWDADVSQKDEIRSHDSKHAYSRRAGAGRYPVETRSLPARSLLPSSLYLDHSHCPVLAPATLAALPSTRAIPDRDVFYVADPISSIQGGSLA
jgi:hypothetical protein